MCRKLYCKSADVFSNLDELLEGLDDGLLIYLLKSIDIDPSYLISLVRMWYDYDFDNCQIKLLSTPDFFKVIEEYYDYNLEDYEDDEIEEVKETLEWYSNVYFADEGYRELLDLFFKKGLIRVDLNSSYCYEDNYIIKEWLIGDTIIGALIELADYFERDFNTLYESYVPLCDRCDGELENNYEEIGLLFKEILPSKESQFDEEIDFIKINKEIDYCQIAEEDISKKHVPIPGVESTDPELREAKAIMIFMYVMVRYGKREKILNVLHDILQ